MGYKYEVYEWWQDITSGDGYKYHLEYEGNSLIVALFSVLKLKYQGAGCVKLEWR